MATQKIRDPLIRRLFRDNDGLHNPFFSGNYFLRGVGGDIGGVPLPPNFLDDVFTNPALLDIVTNVGNTFSLMKNANFCVLGGAFFGLPLVEHDLTH